MLTYDHVPTDAIYIPLNLSPHAQSKKNALTGLINEARKQGMIAAYLNLAAIVAALVVACLIMGLVLGLYGPVYARQQYCNSYYYDCQYSSYYSSYRYCPSYCR